MEGSRLTREGRRLFTTRSPAPSMYSYRSVFSLHSNIHPRKMSTSQTPGNMKKKTDASQIIYLTPTSLHYKQVANW